MQVILFLRGVLDGHSDDLELKADADSSYAEGFKAARGHRSRLDRHRRLERVAVAEAAGLFLVHAAADLEQEGRDLEHQAQHKFMQAEVMRSAAGIMAERAPALRPAQGSVASGQSSVAEGVAAAAAADDPYAVPGESDEDKAPRADFRRVHHERR